MGNVQNFQSIVLDRLKALVPTDKDDQYAGPKSTPNHHVRFLHNEIYCKVGEGKRNRRQELDQSGNLLMT